MSANLVGQVLSNQYRVDAYIDSGGMGVVYQVWDLKRNVPLAMKVLHANLAEDPAALKSFRREANALKKLAHPNIVVFYGVYQTQGIAFLLEAFIDGPTLKDVIKERPGRTLEVAEALSYLKALSAALGYAHAHGVVHCDVKSGNVMVDKGGSVYLTDFGIARHAESTTTTLAGAGTADYMAPEQIKGEAVSAATDVYALGVVLYEMLTGRRPFRGDEKGTESAGKTKNERVQYAHLTLQPPDPRGLNAAIPEGLVQVVFRSLSKEPGRRYPSTQELYLAACAAAGILPGKVGDRVPVSVETPPPPPPNGSDGERARDGRNWRDWLRGKAWLVVGGGSLLVGLIVIVLALMDGPPPPPPPVTFTAIQSQSTPDGLAIAAAETVAAQLTEISVKSLNVTTPTDTLATEFTPTEIPTSTPDPTDTPTSAPPTPEYIVFAKGGTGPDTNDDLYIVSANGGSAFPLVSSSCDEREPAISRDGRSVAYQSNCDGSDDIWIVDVNGGAPYNLTNTAFQDEREPDWSPDGAQLVYKVSPTNETPDKNGEIWVINADGTGGRSLGIQGRGPAWSPDGDMIAYMFKDELWQIFVYEKSSRRSTIITNCDIHCRWPDWSPDSRYVIFNKAAITSSMPPEGIWYVPVSGGEPVALIPNKPVGRPSWSATSLIAFNNSEAGIDVIRQDGSQWESMTPMSDAWAPSW